MSAENPSMSPHSNNSIESSLTTGPHSNCSDNKFGRENTYFHYHGNSFPRSDILPLAVKSNLPFDKTNKSVKITSNQIDFIHNVIKESWNENFSQPFKNRVDPEKFGIPDYPKIIKCPIDLKTIKTKIQKNQYPNSYSCLADLNQMFVNCFIYNSPCEYVVDCASQLESFFNSKFEKIPFPEIITPITQSKKSRPSTGNDSASNGSAPSFPTSSLRQKNNFDYIINDPSISESLRNCYSVLKELKDKRYKHINYIFLEPVDVIKWNLPDYHEIIRQPMDLKTMETKLTNREYGDHNQFSLDFNLMIDNCIKYNGMGSHYGDLAKKFQKVFQDLFKRKVLSVSNAQQVSFMSSSVPTDSLQTISILSTNSLPLLQPFVAQNHANTHSMAINASSNVAIDTNVSHYNQAANSLVPSSISRTKSQSIKSNIQDSISVPNIPLTATYSSHSHSQNYSSHPSVQPLPTGFPPNFSTNITSPHIESFPSRSSVSNNIHAENTDALGVAEEALLDILVKDYELLCVKSNEISALVEKIRTNIQSFCDKRPSSFAGLQKFLTARGFETLPEFFTKQISFRSANVNNNISNSFVNNSHGSIHSLTDDVAPFLYSGPDELQEKIPAPLKRSFSSKSKKQENVESDSMNGGVLNGFLSKPKKIRKSVKKQRLSNCESEPVISSRLLSISDSMPSTGINSNTTLTHQQNSSLTASSSLPLPFTSAQPSQFSLPEMDYEEKKNLSIAINNLPQNELPHVVNIIKSHQMRGQTESSVLHSDPNSTNNQQEFEIDFDLMDLKTLHALKDFVTRVHSQQLHQNRIQHDAYLQQPHQHQQSNLLQPSQPIMNRNTSYMIPQQQLQVLPQSQPQINHSAYINSSLQKRREGIDNRLQNLQEFENSHFSKGNIKSQHAHLMANSDPEISVSSASTNSDSESDPN